MLKNAVFKCHQVANQIKIVNISNFFHFFFLLFIYFCYFCNRIPISQSNWKVYHPSEKPNSKGSIEVRAMLKQAMVTHQMLKRVLGGNHDIMIRRSIALCSRRIETSQTSYTSRNIAMMNVLGMCLYAYPL